MDTIKVPLGQAGDAAVLTCPGCDGEFVHHGPVRERQGADGQQVVLDCEFCGGTYRLVIMQHKDWTLLWTEPVQA